MADSLAAIEAVIPMLATQTHLDKIESEITTLNERIAEVLAETRKTRDEVRLLTGMVQGVATAGQALTE